MPSTKKLLIIFIPAILIASFALFIRVIQYIPTADTSDEKQEQIENQSLIPIFSQDPIIGDKKAPATVIMFGDYACESCAAQDMMIEELLKKYPKRFKVVWKGLPVAKFPYDSYEAHKYAYCAGQQDKFSEFSKLAFTNSDNLSTTALSRIVNEIDLNQDKLGKCLNSTEADIYIESLKNLAVSLNIQAVPAIFIDNKQVKTPQIIEEWETLLKL